MQWSADLNAGFSTAPADALFSRVIDDPVYSYQAVNVAAQEADAASLLHWMRYLVALRKLFLVFGRGSLDILQPENRTIFAHVRRLGDDVLLCVANLSRVPQPVLLDLRDFAGATPVEMLGYTSFPTIGSTPYPLTLGPYGYYWFELQRLDA